MSREEKKGISGVILGPVLVLVAISALWKNETRFDYYKAAYRAPEATSLSDAEDDQALSYTGSMNPDLTIEGKYVTTFTGQLVVYREAEIYAWDRDEDDEGRVSWDLEWMSSVESNSRNSGVSQQLRSGTMLPPKYLVGDLTVSPKMIEFVDSTTDINVGDFARSAAGQRLQAEAEYLYLYKNQADRLGDERMRYTGIRVPATATYFGKKSQGRGVADTTHRRTGILNQLINDSGILHHIVAGERSQALATMKRHITRLKWIVRFVGTLAVCGGFWFLFASLFHFLFQIPILGQFAEWGAFALACIFGIPLAILTIVAGFLAGHPVLLFFFCIALMVASYFAYQSFRNGKATQQAIKGQLDAEHGHQLSPQELKELEYLELAQLAGAKSGIGKSQETLLNNWGRKHRWDQTKQSEMLQKAKTAEPPILTDSANNADEQRLRNVVRLAVADGELTAFEMRSIQTAASQAGYSRANVRELMNSVRRTAMLRSNFIGNAGASQN